MIWGGIFEYDEKKEKLEKLKQRLEDPNIWSDQALATELQKKMKALEKTTSMLTGMTDKLEELDELWQLAKGSDERDMMESLTESIAECLKA